MMEDALKNMSIKSESYDIRRIATVYYNASASRAWTAAKFNNRDKFEPSVEIPLYMAYKFVEHQISRDAWLSRFFPKQMGIYQKAMEETKKQILGL